MIPFVVFIFCLFLTYAIYLVATRGSEKRRQRLNQRLAESLMHSADAADAEIQLARSELMSEIPAMNRALLHVPVATRLKRVLDQADLQITVTRLLMFSVMAGLLAAMAASVLTVSLVLIAFVALAAASV